ncbi:MAG: MgtC/SapB family protein [Acidobacteriaceae bacterium]|nr:MgtC/SapB family protein [Acidobacteriaceae bacterium]MBV9222489.1 MgtC/SapB family protein [Acidobacteriaceae bacterium]MBV9306275.1 MgtC/SapB family protein [Acidobacteriaceae bacterium]MBV9940120.1 MgtC/SapB family protein [Acidobacteriaceae bacterium]
MANPWLHWWTDTVALTQQPTFPRLLLALVLGSFIGAERQWRQRAAGMRTNTLVCFGAAAFADLGATIGGPGTTNIIAYIISGVGFLGAGAIMKEGGSIRGLNTAATLWCSAAVGACAGAGEMLDAVFVTVLLISINLALRPISRYIDRRSIARSLRAVDRTAIYRISVVCPFGHESEVRAALLQVIAERPLLLRELRTEDIGAGDEALLRAEVQSEMPGSSVLEEVTSQLRKDELISSVEWAEAPLELE